MINATFNNQLKILETQFKNDVSLNQLLDFINDTTKNACYPRTLKILADAQHVVFKFSINDLVTIKNETNRSLEYYDSIASAIIINNPKTAAITTLFQTLTINETSHFDVFSTKEAALNWLNTF